MDELIRAVRALDDALAQVTNNPDALASVFCDMDAGQQAQFFERVASLSAAWPFASKQWHAMRREMSPKGLQLLSDFVES